MLEQLQISANRERFIEIMKTKVARPGVDKLLEWMDQTDFFRAPASTRFHEPYEGGLCEHSLTVYDKLAQQNALAPEQAQFTEEQLAICALLHDLCKANFYKLGTRNQKNEQTGQWEKVPFYSVEDQFPMGHGDKSVFLIERFVRLKPMEAMAIRWHMGGFDEAVRGGSYSCSNAFEMHPQCALLHVADLMATYVK